MRLLKKLDNYLLHHHPSFWITRLHYFGPLAIAIILLLGGINILIGWDPRSALPEEGVPIMLMIFPVLIYLVYWFIFQSRYNVAKSGGKMSVFREYQNYGAYLIVFFLAFMLILAIPISHKFKVKNEIDTELFKRDVVNLNLGNTLVFGEGNVNFLEDGLIEFSKTQFFYESWYYTPFDNHYFDYEYDESGYGYEVVTHENALKIIRNFVKSYNRYAKYPITDSAEEILDDRMSGAYTSVPSGGDWDYAWKMEDKMSNLYAISQYDYWYSPYQYKWFWRISFIFIGLMALLVWIFKQMILRYFVFGLIALVLTPLLMAVIGIILFEMLDMRDDGKTFVRIILFIYAIAGTLVAIGAVKKDLHRAAYISTMYLQFFLPILPMFIWMEIRPRWDGPFESDSSSLILLRMGWIILLVSIAVFKPLYTKFRTMPTRK